MKQFSSMADLAAHLAGLAVVQHEANHRALEHAAKVVEREAKNRIGEYQDASGPFAGWAELADSTKADRVAQGYSENEPGLRSGEMRDSIGHRVGDGDAHIGSDDDKLVWFELGTENQPPRSVLDGAAVAKEAEVVAIIGESAVAALVGEEVAGNRLLITGGAD
ncbi:MAG: hypothetical protein M0006_10220 [Magnetospirillum sp.]|nr:hypothetical protein [Magnetospirillum sp.]